MDSDMKHYLNQISKAKDIFQQKLKDYGPSWRVFRLLAVADQIFIKAYRIRTIQQKQKQKVDDSILDDFLGIYNYGIIGHIQFCNPDENDDWEHLQQETAERWYQKSQQHCLEIYTNKNHDYGNVWKQLSLEGITDLILTKILRIRQILFCKQHAMKSEGVESHFIDVSNYAIFASLKLSKDI